jgi:hypothetical protein
MPRAAGGEKKRTVRQKTDSAAAPNRPPRVVKRPARPAPNTQVKPR